MADAPEAAPATDAPQEPPLAQEPTPAPQPEPRPEPEPDVPTEEIAEVAEEEPDKPLGEAGERALKREREARRAAEARYREAQEEHVKELAEVRRELGEALVGAEIKAAATVSFADASDALLNIDPGDVVDSKGRVDPAKLEAALAQLLEKKPHLAAATTPRSNGFDNGAKPLTNGAPDMNSLIRQVAGR